MKPKTENPFATDQARWQALVQRDSEADGLFFYGVLTTLVYCRPNCSSRRPNYENVRFFDTREQAEEAGFRACKKCRPHIGAKSDRRDDIIVKACRIIDNAEDHVPLKDLAAQLGLSAFYFQRLFKHSMSITPKQYAMQKRLKKVQARLKDGTSVTDAVFEAGFSSISRFYEISDRNLGMTPSQYRSGAAGIQINVTVAKFSLGWVLIGATGKGICAIELGDSPADLKARLRESFPNAVIRESGSRLDRWVKQVLSFLENPRQGINLPLDIRGTAFQRQVWHALRDIPVGSTASYSDIAEKIGKPTAARAVARACAANKIAVAVPCHRVVKKDGDLGGYRWGVEKKRMVLEKEAE